MSSAGPPGRQIGFKRHLHAEVSPGEGTYLFSEHGVTLLKGPHIEALSALLDGTRDLETLLCTPPAGLAPADVAGVLARLAEAGLVTTRSPQARGIAEQVLAYWEAGGLDAELAVAGVAGSAVRLLTVGEVDGSAALSALRSAGLTVTVDADLDSGATSLSVVLCDDYLNPGLDEVDSAHRAANLVWLLAKPAGTTVWCGPIFRPDLPGCWHCLAARLGENRNTEVTAQAALGRQGPARSPAGSIRPLAAMAMSLIALEATKWLAGHRYPGQRGVWTFDSFARHGVEHALRARPQCPACGNPELVREQANRPVVLATRRKVDYADCGHRSLQPEQVLERYRHLVSPVTGIVKEIWRDDRGPAFFNSFRSGPNVAVRAKNVNALRAALRMDNGGKGVTEIQARVGALCEAVERYSASFQGDEMRIRESIRSLGRRAIHPNDCLLYDERQYRSRAAWNAEHGAAQHVPERFDEDAVMDWTPVWSLTQRRHRYLPTRYLYFGAPVVAGRDLVHPDSNGNAAGGSVEDAVLQGLLELVERDAVALWWYNRARLPAVDLDSLGGPWTSELRDVYAGLRREVWALDLTADLGIPAMAAVSRRTDRQPEEIMFGFGAHLDPRIALQRALAELNQVMPAAIAASENGESGWADPDADGWWRSATVANQPYLLPDPARQPRVASDYNYAPCPDLSADVAAIVRRLKSAGMEVLVLDQTRPDIGLPVVKVIVPGMRHFWARLGPGRLYEVPVRLGRQTAPTPYEELNPIPMFF